MAVIDVKITDLEQVSQLKPTDLFLVADPKTDSSGNPIANLPYTSNSIAGATLSAALKESFEQDDLKISSQWSFHTEYWNPATQDIRIDTGNFVDSLSNEARLSSIIKDNQPGWYKDELSSSVFQNNSRIRSAYEQSIKIPNNALVNIDFVERAIAGAYDSLLKKVGTMLSQTGNGTNSITPSHVGQIVISTKLNRFDYSSDGLTATGFNLSHPENATNIRQFYGYGQTVNGVKYPNTQWIMHNGYFLRASTSDVSSGSNGATNNGGQDSVTILSSNLPQHSHTATWSGASQSSSVTLTDYPTSISTAKNSFDLKINTGAADALTSASLSKGSKTIKLNVTPSGTITVKNGGGTSSPTKLETIPKYKNVYVFERIA